MKVVYLYSDNSKDEQPLSDNETRKVPAAPSLIHLMQQTQLIESRLCYTGDLNIYIQVIDNIWEILERYE